eukprot:10645189-Alexandrium_andersonii.AAC.1
MTSACSCAHLVLGGGGLFFAPSSARRLVRRAVPMRNARKSPSELRASRVAHLAIPAPKTPKTTKSD